MYGYNIVKLRPLQLNLPLYNCDVNERCGVVKFISIRM